MHVYMFQGDLYCEECGSQIRQEISEEGACPADPTDESTYDSDEYPKGPYADGGGEADSPCHCAACQVFLENPLTDFGYQNLREMVAEHNQTGRGRADVLREWVSYYGIPEQVAPL